MISIVDWFRPTLPVYLLTNTILFKIETISNKTRMRL